MPPIPSAHSEAPVNNEARDDREHGNTEADVKAQVTASTSVQHVDGGTEQLSGGAYKMTLVLFTSKGGYVTKILDSNSDDIEEACAQLEPTEGSEEVVYRLLLTEDLPKATEKLLENLLQGDRRILLDHKANSQIPWNHSIPHNPRIREVQRLRVKFHVNVSEPPAAISIALPYAIHGDTRLPGDSRSNEMHRSMGLIYDHMMRYMERIGVEGRSLNPFWEGVPPCGFRSLEFLHVAYRRISIQFISKVRGCPLCVILLYPQFPPPDDGVHLDYRHPQDLTHPSTSAHKNIPEGLPTKDAQGENIPYVSASLVHHLANMLEHCDQSSVSVQAMITGWMKLNTQATFREATNTTTRYWCSLSDMIQRPGWGKKKSDVDKCHKSLAYFSRVLVTLIDYLQKAKAEMAEREPASDIKTDLWEQNHLGSVVADRLCWQRMITSLDSIQAEVEQLLQRSTQEAQMKMTKIQIQESQMSIRQAETVKRLTGLAFIFIPISTTCSAFGMNVQGLADKPPPFWVSVIVILLITSLTVLCSSEPTLYYFWAVGRLFRPSTLRKIIPEIWRILQSHPTEKQRRRIEPLPRPIAQLVALIYKSLYFASVMVDVIKQSPIQAGRNIMKQRQEARRQKARRQEVDSSQEA